MIGYSEPLSPESKWWAHCDGCGRDQDLHGETFEDHYAEMGTWDGWRFGQRSGRYILLCGECLSRRP